MYQKTGRVNASDMNQQCIIFILIIPYQSLSYIYITYILMLIMLMVCIDLILYLFDSVETSGHSA